MRLPNLGLRSKVSIIIFLSLLGCFLLLGLVVHGVTQRQIRETIEKQMFGETQLASNVVKEFVEDSIEEVEGHSRDKDLRAAILSWDTKAIDAALDSLVSSMRKFEDFIVFDKHGYIRSISTPPGKAIVGQYYGHRAYFQRAMKTKQAALGEPVISGSLKKPAVHIGVPIKDQRGEIQAVMAAALTLEHLSQKFEKEVVVKPGFIVLISADGKILACPDLSKLFAPVQEVIPHFNKMQKKATGFYEDRLPSENGFVYAWVSLPQYNWILVARHSKQEVYAPLKTIRHLLWGGIIFTLMVAVAACVHFVNRFVLHPLKHIQSDLAEISSGKLPPPDTIKSGDELQVLSEDISKMARSLHRSYESLSQRHRELSVLNAIAAVSSRSLDLQEILETTLEKALLLMDLQVGNVRLYDPVKRKLILAASRGVSPEYLQDFLEIDIDNQDSYAAQAAACGRAVLVEDMRENLRLVKTFLTHLETEKPHGLVCVPMKVRDKLIGTMGFISRENHIFLAEETDIFTSIGNQLAVAIEKATLLKAEREARKKERESEERFRLAFENANTGMCLVTFDGRMFKVNQEMSNIFGYSKEELESMTVNDFTHPEDKTLSPTFIEKATSGEVEHAQFEKRYFHKDGHIIWGQISSSVIRDVQGKPLYFISQVQNITQRKQAEENLLKEKTFSETIVNSLPGIYYLFDKSGRFLRWNKNLEKVTEYSAAEASKMNPLDFFEGKDKKIIAEKIKETFDKGESFVEAELVTKSGKKIPYYFSGSRIITEEGEYLTGMGLDISERKRAEESLRERANELRVLFATGRLLTTSMNLDEILKSIVETTSFLFEVNKCILMLKDDHGYLTFAYTKGIHQDFLDIGKVALGESLSGWIASRGEHLYVPQMDEDSRYKFPELARKHGIRSFLGVPLKAKNEVIGVLNVYTDQIRTYEEEEIRLLSTVGDYAAIAIQQARDRQKLEAQILQRHRELSTLNAIASTLSRSLDLNQVLEDAIDMIMRVMNADKAVIYLREGEKLRLVVHRGLSAALLKRVGYISTGKSYIWKYLKDRDLRIASPVLPPEILRTVPEFEEENIQVALDVKLRGKREDLGFLTVFYCQPREFEEAERHLLVSVGHQVSAAVENAQLYQRTLRSYLQRQVVSEINSEISVQLDLGPLLFLIARRAAELIRADASIIGLYDPRSGRVYPKGWFNMPGEVKDSSLVFFEAEWKAMDGQRQGLLWNKHRKLPLDGVSWNPSEVSALMAQPLHSQGEFLGLILLLNFGEHKFFQEEDREFLALLAGQGAIAIQNAQYIKEIMDLDQQRENYLSNVSHELRTPLTLIRGYSEAVKDGSVEREAEQQECLGIIVTECDRLTRLVEGLLLLPRLEMDDPYKTLQLSLVPINEQITSCLQLIKPDLEEKGILVESQLPIYPKIWADSDMMFQVIFNLLTNAVKFTPVKGKIFLSGKVEDREIELQVMNTGREIPPEHLDRIFDKFYMIEDGLTKKQRGMGLGLYIVQKIVELHRGRVWVKSDAQTGTNFHVALPREGA